MDLDVVLFNFGGNTRVFHDWQKKPVIVGIGESRTCRLDYATARFIAKASKTDTVVLMSKERKLPDELTEILDVLRGVDDQPYDVLLNAFHKVAGINDDDRQPDRMTIRIVLSRRAADIARGSVTTEQDVAAIASALNAVPTPIRDDVDPDKLRKDHEKQQRELPKPKALGDDEASAIDKAEKTARERVKRERSAPKPVVKTTKSKLKRERL